MPSFIALAAKSKRTLGGSPVFRAAPPLITKGNRPMFQDPSDFPFLRTLEENWTQVRAEADGLEQSRFPAWPERFLYNFGWEVFGLYAFGKKLPENCGMCPATAELVERVPGMTTAGFSRMVPGTHISPHVGYTSAVLRCHLGVVVPDGCALRVGT